MKPKVFVLIASILFILVTGLILILGYSSKILLPIFLFIFLVLFFATIIFLIKNTLTYKTLILSSILLILFTISIAMLLTNFKTYTDIVKEYQVTDNAELSMMQSENDYYLSYADYLNQKISEYKTQSALMNNNLAKLKAIELEQSKQTTFIEAKIIEETILVPEEYVYEDYDDNYDEKYYESGEEDD
jgi:glucan phosphoethanolaminetransferase (alkaline phosphatase superfamily)